MRKSALALACFTVGMVSLVTISGVAATWNYAELPAQSTNVGMDVVVNGFVYTPDDMPDVEVTAVQRLSDILNNQYTTENVDNSLEFLLDETIQVYWGNNQDPYVGSMDSERAAQVQELFGDVLELKTEDGKEGVKFILKRQDLNGDGHKEIAMYSTADPLDNTSSSYEGVVCVYVTVFTPIISASGQVTGYKQVCESLRGYCYEIYYSPDNQVPSFSTDEWRDSVGTGRWWVTELPESAKLDYDSYNLKYKGNTTKPTGKTLSEALEGQF